MEEIIYKLCFCVGVVGNELDICKVAKEELSKYATVEIDKNNNVIATMGNLEAKKHIMLDAHIDQIGLVVTHITKQGFLKIAPCGGVDCRTLPGSVLNIHGTKDILGVVVSNPPHLSDSNDNKFKKVCDLYVDTGLNYDELKDIVKVGDYLSFHSKCKKLLNNNVACNSLDNRAGVATLIRCAEMLSKEKIDCKLSIVLSSQEETNAKGASTSTYRLNPDEAIVVDVSFAEQPDVDKDTVGSLGGGPMIGIASSLSREISNKLISLSENSNIPYQLEVMGGKTGTNADKVSVSREGVLSGLISIPQRYMHTPYEVVNLDDIENSAKLLALYVKNGGLDND